MGCGNSSGKIDAPVEVQDTENDDTPISQQVLDKIDQAAEVINDEKMEENIEQACEFCDKAQGFLEKGSKVMTNFSAVFKKVGSIVDTVAPWLGPIGIGLKVCTCLVGLFVRKKKTMSEKDMAKENIRLNKLILKDCSHILQAVKELKLYMKYERDLKKFRSVYNTYRTLLFQEGNQVAWDYMNDGTFKSEILTLRLDVFSLEQLQDLLQEHKNIFQKTKILMKFLIQRCQLFEFQLFAKCDPAEKSSEKSFHYLVQNFKQDMDAYKLHAEELRIMGLMQLSQEQLNFAWKNTKDSTIQEMIMGRQILKLRFIPAKQQEKFYVLEQKSQFWLIPSETEISEGSLLLKPQLCYNKNAYQNIQKLTKSLKEVQQMKKEEKEHERKELQEQKQKFDQQIITPCDDKWYSHPKVRFKKMKNGKGRYISFKVRYSFDLHIGLFEKESPEDGTQTHKGSGVFGICFGGWTNSKLALYHEGIALHKTVEYKNCISNKFKKFAVWLNGKNLKISDGKNVLLDWTAKKDFKKFQACSILNRKFGGKPAEWKFYDDGHEPKFKQKKVKKTKKKGKKEYKGNLIHWCKPTDPEGPTFQQSKDYAKAKGGRLLTKEELKSFIKDVYKGKAIYKGEDQWVAVEGKKGEKNWVQIGDKWDHQPPGTLHCDRWGGYPDWGDDKNQSKEWRKVVLWSTEQKKQRIQWCKPKNPHSPNWEQSKKYVEAQGGRLLTVEEFRNFIKEEHDGKPLYPGEDQWAACIDEKGKKDWIEVGDKNHHCGKSHVADYGYPPWGDMTNPKHEMYGTTIDYWRNVVMWKKNQKRNKKSKR